MGESGLTNGIRLHYLDHGAAAEGAPPLLLLPGLTANAHAFDGLVQAGLTARFRGLALDLRGRGASDKPESGYTMADHAADVIGLLDALSLAQVVPVGHSFGGLLALYLAAHFPQRISRLVILDAALSAASPRTREQIRPALARLGQVYPSWEEYLALIKQAPYLAGWEWDPTVESYYRADVQTNPDGTVQARAHPTHIAAAIEGVLAEDWRAILAAVRQPVLLIQAPGPYGPPEAPPIVSAEQAAETAAILADCRLIQAPGNHMTMLYGPGAHTIVAAIDSFATG